MTTEELDEHWHELRFHVQCSMRYHMRRRRFFERWSTLTNALSVGLGSVTVSTLLSNQFQFLSLWAAAGVTSLQVLDLVVGTNRQAWTHATLFRQFVDLDIRIDSSARNEQTLVELRAARRSIDAEEPPPLRVLSAICYNEVMRVMGYEREQLLRIPAWKRWVSHFVDIGDEAIWPPKAA